MVNVLFICRHNSFRSKVAEAIFNKLYKGNKHKAISRGLIIGPYIYPNTKKCVKEVGYILKGKPKSLTFNEMKNQDIMIIVDDKIPNSIFSTFLKRGKKVIIWKIPDTDANKNERIKKITKEIEKKVKKLILNLN